MNNDSIIQANEQSTTSSTSEKDIFLLKEQIASSDLARQRAENELIAFKLENRKPIKPMALSPNSKFSNPLDANQFLDNCALHLKQNGVYHDLKENTPDDEFLLWHSDPSNAAAHDRITLWFLGEFTPEHRRVVPKSSTARDIWHQVKCMVFENKWVTNFEILSAIFSLQIESNGQEFFTRLQKTVNLARSQHVPAGDSTAFTILYRQMMQQGTASSNWATSFHKTYSGPLSTPNFNIAINEAHNAYKSDNAGITKQGAFVASRRPTFKNHPPKPNSCGWKNPSTGAIHFGAHTMAECRARQAYERDQPFQVTTQTRKQQHRIKPTNAKRHKFHNDKTYITELVNPLSNEDQMTEFVVQALHANIDHSRQRVVLDTGAAESISGKSDNYLANTHHLLSTPISLSGLSGRVEIATHSGSMVFDSHPVSLRVDNVLHLPCLGNTTLLSVCAIAQSGVTIQFNSSGCIGIYEDKIIFTGTVEESGIYLLDFTTKILPTANIILAPPPVKTVSKIMLANHNKILFRSADFYEQSSLSESPAFPDMMDTLQKINLTLHHIPNAIFNTEHTTTLEEQFRLISTGDETAKLLRTRRLQQHSANLISSKPPLLKNSRGDDTLSQTPETPKNASSNQTIAFPKFPLVQQTPVFEEEKLDTDIPPQKGLRRMTLYELHCTMNHFDQEGLLTYVDNNPNCGISLTNRKRTACVPCIAGAYQKKSPPKHRYKYEVLPGQVIHCDLHFHIQTPSYPYGFTHYLTLVDHASKYIIIHLQRKKNQAALKIIEIIKWLTVQTGNATLAIQIDGGTEFRGPLTEFCRAQGIHIKLSLPGDSYKWQNGIAERAGDLCDKGIRTNLIQANMPKDQWAHALLHAVQSRNALPSKTSINPKISSSEILFKKNPSLRYYYPFGILTWIVDRNPSDKKLSARNISAIFLYYLSAYKGAALLNPITGIIHRIPFSDIIKVQFIFPGLKLAAFRRFTIQQSASFSSTDKEIQDIFNPETKAPRSNAIHLQEASTNLGYTASVTESKTNNKRRRISTDVHYDQHKISHISTSEDDVDPLLLMHVNSTTAASSPLTVAQLEDRFHIYAALALYHRESDIESANKNPHTSGIPTLLASTGVSIPKSYKLSLTSSEFVHWKNAIISEATSIVTSGTFEFLTSLPASVNVLSSRWIFTLKTDIVTGDITRFKARLVVGGHRQIQHIDFNEVYAPVVSVIALRAMLSYFATHNYLIHGLDFTTAYLNSDLDENIYMHLPPGFDLLPTDITAPPGRAPKQGAKWVKIRRGLYGLRQSGRLWAKLLQKTLRDLEFIQSGLEHCIFRYRTPHGFIWLFFHVDDTIIGGPPETAALIGTLKKAILAIFKGKDFGPIQDFLKLKIYYTPGQGKLHLSQESYTLTAITSAETILNTSLYPRNSPMDNDYHCHEEAMQNTPATDVRSYQKLIGMLIYLSYQTRPDIATAVNILARQTANPRLAHLKAVTRVFQYLKATATQRLTLGGNRTQTLLAYCDSDHGSTTLLANCRRSRSGYIVFYHGGAIAWFSKLQTITTDSSCYAEYIAMYECTKFIVYLRGLLQENELLPQKLSPTPLFNDNNAANTILTSEAITAGSRHFEFKYFYTKQYVGDAITPLRVKSGKNLADIFTKPLPITKHRADTCLIMSPPQLPPEDSTGWPVSPTNKI